MGNYFLKLPHFSAIGISLLNLIHFSPGNNTIVFPSVFKPIELIYTSVTFGANGFIFLILKTLPGYYIFIEKALICIYYYHTVAILFFQSETSI